MLYDAVEVCFEQHGIHWMAPRPRQACAECIKKFGFIDQGLSDYTSTQSELIKHSLFNSLSPEGINWDTSANPFETPKELLEALEKQPDFVPIEKRWEVRIVE